MIEELDNRINSLIDQQRHNHQDGQGGMNSKSEEDQLMKLLEDSDTEINFGQIRLADEPNRQVVRKKESYYPGPHPLDPMDGIVAMPEEEEEQGGTVQHESDQDDRPCIVCLEDDRERLEYCKCGQGNNWYHYECIAEWIIRNNEMSCLRCNSRFTDPKDRIKSKYRRMIEYRNLFQFLYRIVIRDYKFWLWLVMFILTLSFFSWSFTYVIPEVSYVATICFGWGLFNFAHTIYGYARRYRDAQRTGLYERVLYFTKWPVKGVYPNDTRKHVIERDVSGLDIPGTRTGLTLTV